IIVPQSRWTLQRELPLILEDAENGLPTLARSLIGECYAHLKLLNQRIDESELGFDIIAKHSETVQRLMTIPGVGAQTATAIVASVGRAQHCDSARDFAALLGLVPRQYSTGGKPRLGRITKRGDKYLRMLLIHGTRAVLATIKDKQDRLSLWCKALIERRGYKRATVALAAKNARIIWAILQSGKEYKAFAA
ncbi:IS110 family transposase, partial [Marinobacterium zhoushanense]|uniref:IS110 family transposase n=1 Tax=Marinobacterium zhoushanense TaxID=1679163 RepID=UPI0016668AB3